MFALKKIASIINNYVAGRINRSIRRPFIRRTGDYRRCLASERARKCKRTMLRQQRALLISANDSDTVLESILISLLSEASYILSHFIFSFLLRSFHDGFMNFNFAKSMIEKHSSQ